MAAAIGGMRLSGHFVEAMPGRLFVTAWRSDSRTDSAVLCVPPGVEELNCSRHQLALLGQQVAGCGHDSFLMDYYATGDSEGRDKDASYDDWCASISAVLSWLGEQGYQSVILLGVRVGALVIADFLANEQPVNVAGVVFLQPLESGRQWVSALQRLQLMSGKVRDAEGQFQVAGYQLSEALLAPIRAFDWGARQQVLDRYPLDVVLVGVADTAGERFSAIFPAGARINHADGAPFWGIPETPVNPMLNELVTQRVLMMFDELKGR